jgi:hypothetical protein
MVSKTMRAAREVFGDIARFGLLTFAAFVPATTLDRKKWSAVSTASGTALKGLGTSC